MPIHLPVYSSRSDLYMATRFKEAFEVNVLEEKTGTLNDWLDFKPYETKFVKIEF